MAEWGNDCFIYIHIYTYIYVCVCTYIQVKIAVIVKSISVITGDTENGYITSLNIPTPEYISQRNYNCSQGTRLI